jgi:allantoate deiminase
MSHVEMMRVDPNLIERYLREMGEIGAHSETGVWRTLYSPEWAQANALFSKWSEDAGLAVSTDAVGNVWAKAVGGDGGPSIVSGSHIDTQCPGGRYDGTLGILSALVAVRTLQELYGQPKRTLEVVSFCEEEASRFPAANFWGSRAITGGIGADEPFRLVGLDGVLMSDAMKEVGLDPSRVDEAHRKDIDTFIELHIEQGPILEHAGLSVGVVDAITGLRQTSVSLWGEANHAGAFPMDLRRDPMAGFVEIASGLMSEARRRGRPSVTTVGRCEVSPGGASIIPEMVRFTLDSRHPDPDTLQAIHASNESFMREVAQRHNLKIEFQTNLEKKPSPSAPHLVNLLETKAGELGIPTLRMSSGAGHDCQQMAKIAAVAMIFVQSKNGRSHTPLEFSSIPHIVDGTRLLMSALYHLAY